ncbi:DUF4258 domain-containing protein [Aquisalimonas sp.]|uniref:DUF4258 domain-containing protein n=1 Tax=Aquisalimonas sp. TaxID=1872621 RepID=UPI0025C3FEE0|nr:DUF4258 domain-containing protein [Aquisalimonas sp.]
MDCTGVSFSGHALRRMFERGLNQQPILDTIAGGEVIAEYPDDQPYPSCVMRGFVEGQPVHVVVAREPERHACFVVTAYRPDPGIWSDDFKTRRQ